MKALKSKLAAELLADPVARAQLRQFLIRKDAHSATAQGNSVPPFVIVRRNGERVEATIVPKADTAD